MRDDDAPEEFVEFCQQLGALVMEIEDPQLRLRLFASIEELMARLAGDWRGCVARFDEPVPDSPEDLL